jgi:hypothetical protein
MSGSDAAIVLAAIEKAMTPNRNLHRPVILRAA